MKERELFLGIELGSTRIKAVAVDNRFDSCSTGNYTWASSYENGIWTYPLEQVWVGLRAAISGIEHRECTSAMGISGMMHGYLAFDKEWSLLVPFRTWQNTMTEQAAAELSEVFGFNIPQRWSIAHLYQAVLNGEEHVEKIAHITTLAGYVHYKLTGVNAIGVGEASGMFPIDSEKLCYDAGMIDKMNALLSSRGLSWHVEEVLPSVFSAGARAGNLTAEGAALLGNLLPPGLPMAPPEGDAGTGMIATNAVAPATGNISAGTSIFTMVVLEKQLSKVYPEIDMVTTPAGMPVAMVHCNNCCTDLDYWVNIFAQFAKAAGSDIPKYKIYDLLYEQALNADPDCGGLVNFNYFSGEPVSHTADGRPMFLRTQGCNFNLPNFFRAQIYSAMATLKIGMEILEKENVKIDCLMGHGGLFKTPIVGQKLMAGAMNSPVAVMETAGEGGAWGMALLAKYAVDGGDLPLPEYLNQRVFGSCKSSVIEPDEKDVKGFEDYMNLYKKALAVEKSAYENI